MGHNFIMPEPVLVPLLINVAATSLYDFARYGLQQATNSTPVAIAIQQTASGLNTAVSPDVGTWLNQWCRSPQFKSLLAEVQEGVPVQVTDETIIENFLPFTTTLDPDHACQVARTVLDRFLHCLQKAMLPEPLALHDSREERRHQEDQAAHAKTHELLQHLDPNLTKISRAIPDDGGAADISEVQYHARLDATRKLIGQGKIEAAKSIIDDICTELEGKPHTDYLRFRVETNLGACVLLVGDLETAAQHFWKAHQKQPTNAKGLANLARVALMRQEKASALMLSEQAVNAEGCDASVLIVRLMVLHEFADHEIWDTFVRKNPTLEDDATCLAALAVHRFERSDYGEAEALARKSVSLAPDFAQAWELLGRCIFVPIQTQLQQSRTLPWKIPQSEHAHLEEAHGALSKAADLLKLSDLRVDLLAALVNRSACLAVLGRFDEALRDCDVALTVDPRSEHALRNKASVLIVRDRYGEALECLTQIQGHFEMPELTVSLGICYLQIGRSADAIAVLKPKWEKCSDITPESLLILQLLIEAYHSASKPEQATILVEHLIDQYPDSGAVLAIAAEHESILGNGDRSVELIEKALDKTEDVLKPLLYVRMGDLCFRFQNFEKAIEAYRPAFSIGSDNPVRAKFIIALYKAQHWSEAYTLCTTIRLTEGVVPGVSEVEAHLQSHIGDLNAAIELLRGLTSLDPSTYDLRMKLAEMLFRTGQTEKCREEIMSLSLPKLKGRPRLLITAAKFRLSLDLPDALEFGYEAWKCGQQDPNVQLNYALHVLSQDTRQNPLLRDREQVEVDTTVTLEGNGQTEFVTVLADAAENAIGEVSANSELALKIIGRSKGETVTWSVGPKTSRTYIIKDIRSKYVAACRRVMDSFPFAFPGHGGLMHVDVSPDDPTAILASIEEKHRQGEEAMQLYRTRQIPLGMLANLTGSRVIDAWRSITSMEGERLVACQGSEEERSFELQTLGGSKEIVLDYTCLLTLAELGLLDRLKTRFRRLAVVQGVADEILDSLSQDALEPEGKMFWVKQGGYYRTITESSEVRQKRKELLGVLREFVFKVADILRVESILQLPVEYYNKLEDCFGHGAIPSAMLAAELSLPLCADDLVLRTMASNSYGTKSCWTQSLLMDLRNKRIISAGEYYKAVHNLLAKNYYFVRVSADDIVGFAGEPAMMLGADVLTSLQSLKGPDCDLSSAVNVALGVMKSAFDKELPRKQLDLLLDALVNTLVTNRNPQLVLATLRQGLGQIRPIGSPEHRHLKKSLAIWEVYYRGGLRRFVAPTSN